MKTRIVASESIVLRSGEKLERGQAAFVEEDEAANLVAENKAKDREATASRSAAILPETPSISADRCRH